MRLSKSWFPIFGPPCSNEKCCVFLRLKDQLILICNTVDQEELQTAWSSHPATAAVHSNSPQNENEKEKNSAVANEFENALKIEEEQRDRGDTAALPPLVIAKSEKENNNNNEIFDENNENNNIIVNNIDNNELIFGENTELVEPAEQLNDQEIGSPRIIGSETD